MSNKIQFDWSQAHAFVQDGTIFYSPNCSRTVVIPTRASTHSPFEDGCLDASEFKQPVWWTDVYGWQSFIPLSPSYTSAPFEPFCWMPRIIEFDVQADTKPMHSRRRVRRYEMHPDDSASWRHREQLLTEAAELIRIWFKIPGNMPPVPSKFNYDRTHKTRAMALESISAARDWFAVWMGFVSYLIACTKRYTPSSSPLYSRLPTSSPIPVWYHRLQEVHEYPASWLDGLTASSVCSFDSKNPCAGVVFEWSKSDRTRPPMEWFLEHNILMWFVWTKEEEQLMSRDRTYEFLKPPNELIQHALTNLFDHPTTNIPMAGLIFQCYYHMGSDVVTNQTVKLLNFKEAPSFVLNYTTKIYLSQETALAKVDSRTEASLTAVLMAKRADQIAASQTEGAFPIQSMIENVSEKGRLYNHWEDFLLMREKRQKEIINVESARERQKRISREQNPGIKNADLYTWEKIQSSGGKDVYMRLCVQKKRNEHVYATFKRHQRLYNSVTNEWDLCREFVFDLQVCDTDSASEDTEFEEDIEWPVSNNYRDVIEEFEGQTSQQHQPSSQFFTDANVCDLSLQASTSHRHDQTRSRSPNNDHNSLRRRQYTPPHTILSEGDPSKPTQLANSEVSKLPEGGLATVIVSRDIIETMSYGYGYVPKLDPSTTEPFPVTEWEYFLLAMGFNPPYSDINVLDCEKHAISNFFDSIINNSESSVSSNDLEFANHAAIRHLFDFASIHRPTPDLFVFSGPRSLASDWLLGINHPEIALYVCRYILSNPGAHTVVTVANRLLERGVPFRTLVGQSCSIRYTPISEPYSPSAFRLSNHKFTKQDFETYMLQCQHILSQPQGRAALLQGGIVWQIAKEFLSADGVLSGPSVEVTLHRVGYSQVSGTSGIRYCDDELTANEIATICGTYSLYTATAQIAVKSWFPPPICWTKDRAGVNWVEWTSRNEQFFTKLMNEIRSGIAKLLSVIEWTSRL